MRLSVAFVITIALLAIAVAALAPAELLDRRVAAATEGRLRLADSAGTIWRGRGRLTDAKGTWQLPIAWRASPLALARGTVAVAFGETPDSGIHGEIAASAGAIALTGVKAALPATALQALAAQGVVPALGGVVAIDVPALRVDGAAADGGAELRWEHARVVVSGTPLDLGTVTARGTARGTDVAGTIASAGGAVRIAGDFSLARSQAAFNATLVPGPDVPADVARTLASLGVADGNGGIRIAWSGVLW